MSASTITLRPRDSHHAYIYPDTITDRWTVVTLSHVLIHRTEANEAMPLTAWDTVIVTWPRTAALICTTTLVPLGLIARCCTHGSSPLAAVNVYL